MTCGNQPLCSFGSRGRRILVDCRPYRRRYLPDRLVPLQWEEGQGGRRGGGHDEGVFRRNGEDGSQVIRPFLWRASLHILAFTMPYPAPQTGHSV